MPPSLPPPRGDNRALEIVPLDHKREENDQCSPAAVAEHATRRSWWRDEAATTGRMELTMLVVDLSSAPATFRAIEEEDRATGAALALGAAAALALLPLPRAAPHTPAERVLARAEAIIVDEK